MKKATFKVKLDKSKCLGSSADITRDALEKALEDPKFEIKYGYGSEIRKIAKEILHKSNKSQFESYAKDLVNDVYAAVNAGDAAVTSAAQELIWTEFHKIRTAEEVKAKWASFLSSLDIKGRSISINLLHQYLLRTVLLSLILTRTM